MAGMPYWPISIQDRNNLFYKVEHNTFQMMYLFIAVPGDAHALPGRHMKILSWTQNQQISIAAEMHTNPKSFVFSEAQEVIVH